jgi:hypothetical protein
MRRIKMSCGRMMPHSLRNVVSGLLSVLHGISKLYAATIAAK